MPRLIRYTALILAALSVTLVPCGCKRKEKPKIQVQATVEEKLSLATLIHVGDPRAAAQLLYGFYNIEQDTWRWTARKFAVVLAVPENAAAKKMILQLKLAVPEPVAQQLKSLTLSARVNGEALPPETYSKPGEYVYLRDVPAKALGGDSAQVEFLLDKALQPGPADARELGVVVTTVGFDWK